LPALFSPSSTSAPLSGKRTVTRSAPTERRFLTDSLSMRGAIPTSLSELQTAQSATRGGHLVGGRAGGTDGTPDNCDPRTEVVALGLRRRAAEEGTWVMVHVPSKQRSAYGPATLSDYQQLILTVRLCRRVCFPSLINQKVLVAGEASMTEWFRGCQFRVLSPTCRLPIRSHADARSE
jgi:hypothetical protein